MRVHLFLPFLLTAFAHTGIKQGPTKNGVLQFTTTAPVHSETNIPLVIDVTCTQTPTLSATETLETVVPVLEVEEIVVPTTDTVETVSENDIKLMKGIKQGRTENGVLQFTTTAHVQSETNIPIMVDVTRTQEAIATPTMSMTETVETERTVIDVTPVQENEAAMSTETVETASATDSIVATRTSDPAPTRITEAEAHARVIAAKAVLDDIRARVPSMREAQEIRKKADEEFKRKKVEFIELYANKTEQLYLEEKACYEASNSSIVVKVKGVIRHNIQFGKFVCAPYGEKRVALEKEHDAELLKICKEWSKALGAVSVRDLQMADRIFRRERGLLNYVRTGASDAVIKNHNEHTTYLKNIWNSTNYSEVTRANIEYQRYNKFKDYNINWAHDVLRPNEVRAAMRTIKGLVQNECRSMRLINGKYYSMPW